MCAAEAARSVASPQRRALRKCLNNALRAQLRFNSVTTCYWQHVERALMMTVIRSLRGERRSIQLCQTCALGPPHSKPHTCSATNGGTMLLLGF
jgi:hypothetical protein